MPAENEEFPWLSYYKNYDYFEEIIKNHNKIYEKILLCLLFI